MWQKSDTSYSNELELSKTDPIREPDQTRPIRKDARHALTQLKPNLIWPNPTGPNPIPTHTHPIWQLYKY